MTTTPDFRALAQELFKHARQAQAILIGEGLWDVDDDEGLFDRADKALATPPPEPPTELPVLTPGYIDFEHTGQDREILDAFYRACNSEGGTADEIHLRGIRAVLERWGHG